MNYELNKAYEVRWSPVYYDTVTDCAIDPKSSTAEHSQIIVTNAAGEPIRRSVRLFNRKFTFWYFTKPEKAQIVYDAYFKVNANDIVVAGITVPKKTGIITNISATEGEVQLDSETQTLCKVYVTIEMEVERPVLNTRIVNKGVFFVHPSTGRRVHIQHTCNPEELLAEYSGKGAVHVRDGYGWYCESRHDLDITEPILLTKEGGIAAKVAKVNYIYAQDRLLSSWSTYGLPKEVGREVLV